MDVYNIKYLDIIQQNKYTKRMQLWQKAKKTSEDIIEINVKQYVIIENTPNTKIEY